MQIAEVVGSTGNRVLGAFVSERAEKADAVWLTVEKSAIGLAHSKTLARLSKSVLTSGECELRNHPILEELRSLSAVVSMGAELENDGQGSTVASPRRKWSLAFMARSFGA